MKFLCGIPERKNQFSRNPKEMIRRMKFYRRHLDTSSRSDYLFSVARVSLHFDFSHVVCCAFF